MKILNLIYPFDHLITEPYPVPKHEFNEGFWVPQKGLSVFKQFFVQSAVCGYEIPTFHQLAPSVDKLMSNLMERFMMA